MKIGFFTTAEAYADWNRREAEAIRNNGLRIMKEELNKALNDEDTKVKWLSMNGLYAGDIDDLYRQVVWGGAHQMDARLHQVAGTQDKEAGARCRQGAC